MDIGSAIYQFKSFWDLLGKDGYKLKGIVTVKNGKDIYCLQTHFYLKENKYQRYEITFDTNDFTDNGKYLQYSAYNVHFQDFSFDKGILTIKCKDGLQICITDVKLA
jgi:hypothetical protein